MGRKCLVHFQLFFFETSEVGEGGTNAKKK